MSTARRQVRAERESRAASTDTAIHRRRLESSSSTASAAIDTSARMVAQRRQFEAAFGAAVRGESRIGAAPIQAQMAPVQRKLSREDAFALFMQSRKKYDDVADLAAGEFQAIHRAAVLGHDDLQEAIRYVDEKVAAILQSKVVVPEFAPLTVLLSLSGVSSISFELRSEHASEPGRFHEDVRTALASKRSQLMQLPAACFSITHGNKEIPLKGPWPESVPLAENMRFTVTIRPHRAPEVVDEELIRLVNSLDPDLVVPCSQIDNTHTQDPDSQRLASSSGPPRFLSVDNLRRQQKLDLVLEELQNEGKFSLVLIDPSFASGGIERSMVQIVEYLEGKGYPFTATQHGGHHATTFRCGKVSITYIGVKVNGVTSARLPKMGSI